jgi:hypothetical protein
MPNIKQIDWDKIRADYVLGTDYPSFDELSKRYNLAKPTILAKANNLDDPVNRGKTWIQQRQTYIEKKQQLQEDVAVNEAKKSVAMFVKVLNNVGLRAFKIINRDLEFIDKEQAEAINKGNRYPIHKVIKISDITKIVEVLHKLSGSESKELLVKLELAGKKAEDNRVRLQDLSDEELDQVDRQVKSGGILQPIDTEFEVVEENENGSD